MGLRAVLAASLGAHRKAQHADVDAEMDLNDLMAVFLVISRSTSVLGSAGRSFLPAELRAAFCWSSAKQRKSVKKDVLPRPRSNWGALPVGLYSDMTCPRALAPFMTTGRRPVSQLESREEIGP